MATSLETNPDNNDNTAASFSSVKNMLNRRYTEGAVERKQREALGLLARAGETALGWAGNTKSFIDNLILGSYENAPLHGIDTEKPMFGIFSGPKENQISPGQKQREAPDWLRRTLKGRPGGAFQPPTSQQIRENFTQPLSQAATGSREYLEPQNEQERYAQEIASGITEMFTPGSGRLPFLTKLASPFAGQNAKELFRYFGGSSNAQEMAKIATTGAFTLANTANGRQFASDMRQQAHNMVPNNATGAVRTTIHEFNDIRNKLSRGDPKASWKQPALHFMDTFEQKIQNGRINIQDVISLKEDLNKARRGLGAFNVPGPQHKEAVRELERVNNAINETLHHYSMAQNPNFWPAKRLADQAWAVTERSGALSRFIEKHWGKPFVSDTAKILFGSALVGGTSAIPVAGATIGGLAGLAQTTRIMNRVANSPLLRKYYQDAVTAASHGQVNLMRSSLQKLDQEAAKDERKQKKKSKVKPID